MILGCGTAITSCWRARSTFNREFPLFGRVAGHGTVLNSRLFREAIFPRENSCENHKHAYLLLA